MDRSSARCRLLMIVIFTFSQFQLDRAPSDVILRLLSVYRYVYLAAVLMKCRYVSEAFGFLFSMNLCQQMSTISTAFGMYKRGARTDAGDVVSTDGETSVIPFQDFWNGLRRFSPSKFEGTVYPVAFGCMSSTYPCFSRSATATTSVCTHCTLRIGKTRPDDPPIFAKYSVFHPLYCEHVRVKIFKDRTKLCVCLDAFDACRAAITNGELRMVRYHTCHKCYRPCHELNHPRFGVQPGIGRIMHTDQCIQHSIFSELAIDGCPLSKDLASTAREQHETQ